MIWRDAGVSGSGEIDPERELEMRLVAQAHAGAAWALSSLVARYQPPVVRYLIRLTGDQERAYTLAEQVFIHMARRLRGPQRGEHLRLWLLRTSTDLGLDVLRQPTGHLAAQLAAPKRPPALPPARGREGTVSRVLHVFGGRSRKRNSPRLAPPTQEFVWGDALAGENGLPPITEPLSPREQVRHRLTRAVLAELSYSDAQCLALHLVAGLNQTEVALALGVLAPVARRRIVQGLQLFGRRYEATLASLGLPKDFADADVAGVSFTEAGGMIAQGVVPDETGVDEGETAEAAALRREREVTGTLVVPTEVLPALEELFANEPDGPAVGVAAEAAPPTDVAPPPGALDPQAAAAVYLPEETAAEADAPAAEVALDVLAPAGATASAAPELESAAPHVAAAAEAPGASQVDSMDVAPDVAAVGAQTTDEVEPPAGEADWLAALESEPDETAVPARTVPVLARAATAQRAARPTPPLADLSVSPTGGASAGDELLIEWGSNPEISIHGRSDVNAVLDQPDQPDQPEAAAASNPPDESDWLLVLDDERDEPAASTLEKRRRRILSADGEAEDPDESRW